MLGTRELMTEDLNVEETDFSHILVKQIFFKNRFSNHLRIHHYNMSQSSFSNLNSFGNSTHIPDIEAVVGIGGVFGPLEQSPLKLHSDLSDRVGRKLDEHLQQVGPHTVLRRLVVDEA